VEDFQNSEVFKYAEDSYTKVYMELMDLREHLRSEVASHMEEVRAREARLATQSRFDDV